MGIDVGSLRGAGDTRYYWIGTAYISGLYAYAIYLTDAKTYPSSNNLRWFGFTAHPNQFTFFAQNLMSAP